MSVQGFIDYTGLMIARKEEKVTALRERKKRLEEKLAPLDLTNSSTAERATRLFERHKQLMRTNQEYRELFNQISTTQNDIEHLYEQQSATKPWYVLSAA